MNTRDMHKCCFVAMSAPRITNYIGLIFLDRFLKFLKTDTETYSCLFNREKLSEIYMCPAKVFTGHCVSRKFSIF